MSTIFGLTIEAWLTVLAIVLGPILALWLQRISDARKEARNRKLWVFRELMATRAVRLSGRHVEALNLIDLEFDGQKAKDRKVLGAWRVYLDSLANTPKEEHLQEAFFQRRDDQFFDLVYEMGQYLGFVFDKVMIRRNSYIPLAHGELEDDQRLIRKGIVELLTGKRALSTLSWLMPDKDHPYPIQVVAEQLATSAAAGQRQLEAPAQKQPISGRANVQASILRSGRDYRLRIINRGTAAARKLNVELDGKYMMEHPLILQGEAPVSTLGSGADATYILAVSLGSPGVISARITWEDSLGEPGLWESELKI